MNNIPKLAKIRGNGARKMKFSLIDGGEHAESNSSDFVGISKIFSK